MFRRHSDAFLSSSGMDDLWDDIDDDVLVRMSQMAEEKVSGTENNQESDFMVLSECEEDWNSCYDADENRFNQMQTQFPATSKNAFKRPLSPISGNTKKQRREDKDSDAIIEENKKLKSTNQKLNEEIYTKRGEVALLRADLRKKESSIEQERSERQKLLALKNEELLQFREQCSKSNDAVKTDNDFLSHQLTQTEEKLKQMEMLISNGGSQVPGRRVPDRRTNGFPDHDISTIVQDPKRISPRKRSCNGKDASCQADIKTKSPYQLQGSVQKGHLTSAQIVSILGSEGCLDVLGHDFSLFGNINSPNGVKDACRQTADVLLSSINLEENDISKKLNASKFILNACSVNGDSISQKSFDKLLELLSTKDVQKEVLFAFFSLGEVLLRKNYIREDHFEKLLVVHTELLKSQSCSRLTGSLLTFLSSSASSPKIAQKYCKMSNNSCFIFELCGLITRSSSLSPEGIGDLSESFLMFLFAHISSPEDLSWIGSLQPDKICNPCRMDILKTISFLTVRLLQQAQQLDYEGEDISLLKFCLKMSISCLHKLWSTDPNFVQNLSDSPGSQREYIWATKELSKMEAFLGLCQDDILMLADLNVQYDQR